ncbi:beta-channel forming toxin NetG (plasmid) [Clostridium perfringens]|uniref:Leukocidin/Hemolysin toxin family n=1 Tax=Clostridium perfringens TaxID=1502 RepID=A0A0D3QH83_CLOPF|nr:beta-channel forming toxin NetG [Clostridium perfringens]AJF36070.1 necrotizing enteritis toxin NetG [Clostridium perfringens]AKF16677.1 Leukocidin/Hemolysin toxin family [Clostridium perfringens]ALD82542.1 necrotizing enteritis toxin (NetG) [Clostridium perfringens]
MRRLFCSGLVALTLITGNISYVRAATLPEIIESNGKKAELYTSSDANDTNDVKTSISASFIEDEHDSNLTALINLKGFIPSKLIKTGDYYHGRMDWPSKYRISVLSVDYNDNEEVKIIESIPSNKIETIQVSESIGYTVGGEISANKESASGGLNANYSVQRSISYEQPDFKTVKKSDSTKAASWDVVFNCNKDGYDRNSHHPFYGNQLFMKSRLYNTGINNLTDNKDLSTLISGGFSPNMAVALKAPKGTKKSQLILSYQTYHDLYKLDWTGTEWWGSNHQAKTPTYATHAYEIDWENHKVTFKY